MRADGIVVLTPGLDDHLRLATAAEPLQAQTLVAEATVEALVGTVLPRLARIDQRGLHASGLQPLQDRLADEFRTVVRTQVSRRTTLADQAGKHLDDTPRADAAGDVDCQALAGVLVDHGEAF